VDLKNAGSVEIPACTIERLRELVRGRGGGLVGWEVQKISLKLTKCGRKWAWARERTEYLDAKVGTVSQRASFLCGARDRQEEGLAWESAAFGQIEGPAGGDSFFEIPKLATLLKGSSARANIRQVE
jgi:hypothetical protein